MHFLGDLSRIFLDRFHIFRRDMDGWDNAGGISGMYACQFDMFHNSRDEGICSVADGIRLTLQGMI